MKRALITVLVTMFSGSAIGAPQGYFDLAPGVTLETGEAWVDPAGVRYRLYGVQSCLRGTNYTNKAGQERDCGDASLAVFGAFIKDTKPICAPVARTDDQTYVMCYATIGGQRLDLGTVLISSGYAFAALDRKGLPYHTPYAVAEQVARQNQVGLWQFEDVQHPSIFLSRNATARAQENTP
jgi:endonuclease YncB( thermonuclease family)